jgi:dihydrofolate reductase
MASAFRKIRSSRKTSLLCWGADIFRQALELPSVQTLYLSWVMTAVEGDTYFPPISEEWQPIRWEVFNKGPGVPIPFIFFVYHR